MQENVDIKLLILVCGIDINTCSFVNFIMKITYYGLEDVTVIFIPLLYIQDRTCLLCNAYWYFFTR